MFSRNSKAAMMLGPVAALSVASAASAAGITVSDPIMTFTASNGVGNGSVSIPLAAATMNFDGSFSWIAPGAFDITDGGGNVIATVTQAVTFLGIDPLVAMNFTIVAGVGGGDVDIMVTSATVTPMMALNGVVGRTSGAMTLTDSNGDTASSSGAFAGGAHYEAYVNGGGLFAGLLTNPLSATAGGSDDENDEFPNGGGYSPIAGMVNDISAKFSFSVSEGDQISGNSVFVVPSAGSVGLLAIGALASVRRRR